MHNQHTARHVSFLFGGHILSRMRVDRREVFFPSAQFPTDSGLNAEGPASKVNPGAAAPHNPEAFPHGHHILSQTRIDRREVFFPSVQVPTDNAYISIFHLVLIYFVKA